MKYIIFIILFLYSTVAMALPTEEDRQKALSLLYTVGNGQEQTFIETSNYQSISPRMVGDLIVSSCAYSTFDGKGYISTVSKVEKGKVYIIQRHEGEADPVIDENWTCKNCNGENYDVFTVLNEHQLCSIKETVN